MADEYKADIIPLDGGLDFVTGKPLVKPGSLLDCLNYETVDRIGYKRIDGFNRYDGRPSPALQGDTYFEIADASYVGTLSDTYPVGTLLEVTTDRVFGVVVGLDESTNTIKYARINQDYEPDAGDTVQAYGAAGAFQPDAAPAVASISGGDAEDYVAAVNDFSAILRGEITSLHDRPIGLHWFRDRLYAVVDEAVAYYNSGSTEIKPNDYIKSGTATARVLNVTLASGTWAGTDAAGSLLIEVLDGTWLTSGDIDIYPTSAFSVASTSNAATLTTGTATAEFAGLWQARTYEQAISDLADANEAGWKKIDLGWEIDYVDGFSEAGEFTRIKRGQENNFSFDTDSTSISGTAGRAGSFYNGAKIPGDAPSGTAFGSTLVSDGAPGWKSTGDDTTFATDDDDIETDDSSFLFGDILWNSSANALAVSRQNAIYGPTDNVLTAFTVAGVDDDIYSCNARAPIILNNLAVIADEIPDNAVLNGIEVSIMYKTKLTYRAVMRTSKTPHTHVPAWLNDQHRFAAYIGEFDASANTFITQGTKQTATCETEDTPASYTTYTGASDGSGVATQEGVCELVDQTATIGSSTNVFGADILTKESLLDDSFGIALFVDLTNGAPYPGTALSTYMDGSTIMTETVSGATRVSLDRVRIKIYYTLPSVKYYFEDGAGEQCTADLVYYTVVEGDLVGGTASGKWQVVNIEPVGASTKRTILKGDTIHVATPTATNQIAKVADADGVDTGDVGMTLNGLPPLADLLDVDGRYQFVTANFYARDDWDGFFGVSGADRAFSFSKFDADGDGTDEEYVIKITTNLYDVPGDRPRHVAYYHGHLALGFQAGSVRLSVAGEPEDFSGEFGAADISVGDRVVGLLTLKGTTLGVFCENSIWAITGTTIDNYGTQVLSPSTGALEYTVVDIGEPVFCDNRGISTLSQSEKYGDFAGTRLSAAVSPWILKRLIKNKSLLSVANGAGVVCAIPFRSTNQYKLFFRDGYVLTMTMSAGDTPPEYTLQKYYLGQTDADQTERYLVPIAWSAQVDDAGVDRIHVGHYSSTSEAPDATHNYVYELNSGWSFDGNFIPAYFVLNWHPLESPLVENTLRKVRVDGLSKGYSNIRFSVAKDYEPTFSTTTLPINLPRSPLSTLHTDFIPVTNINDTNVRGRVVTVKFENEIPTGSTITDPEPSHICQVLVAWYVGGKLDG